MSDVVVATIKIPGKDKPWLVFHGENVEHTKSLIAEAYDLDNDGLSLHETVVLAQKQAESVEHVVKVLGGTPIPGDSASPSEGGSEAEEEHILLTRLRACETANEVKRLWAANRTEFDADPELTKAMKARYKELK